MPGMSTCKYMYCTCVHVMHALGVHCTTPVRLTTLYGQSGLVVDTWHLTAGDRQGRRSCLLLRNAYRRTPTTSAATVSPWARLKASKSSSDYAYRSSANPANSYWTPPMWRHLDFVSAPLSVVTLQCSPNFSQNIYYRVQKVHSGGCVRSSYSLLWSSKFA